MGGDERGWIPRHAAGETASTLSSVLKAAAEREHIRAQSQADPVARIVEPFAPQCWPPNGFGDEPRAHRNRTRVVKPTRSDLARLDSVTEIASFAPTDAADKWSGVANNHDGTLCSMLRSLRSRIILPSN